MKNKVIKFKNLPTRLHLGNIVVTVLALDHWHAPLWLYGAFGMFWLIVIIAAIAIMNDEEKADVMFKEEEKK